MCIIMLSKTSLPVNWQLINLEEVISPRKEKIHPNDINGELYIGLEHITSNNLNITNFGSSEGLKSTKGVFYSGDILYGKLRPYLNKVVLSDCKGVCSTDIIVFQIKNELVLSKYIANILRSIFFVNFATMKMSGANLPRVSWGKLKKFEIPIPPLQTQKKLVENLENAEKLKEWRFEADELADDYLKSVFLKMFGHSGINPKNWPLMKAEEICLNEKSAIKAGPFGSSLKKEFYVEKGYKIYGQEQVIRDDLTFGDYYIPKEIYKKLENCKIKEGDILISLVGSYGKISIVPKQFEPGIINPRLMKISLNQKIILPVFFKFLLNSEGIKKKIQQVSHGGTMDIINVKIIKQLDFPIPPIELQNQFVEIVQQVETLKSYQSQSKQQIDNLFNTLMQKAFKGELVC